jgi:site-specific DNA-methyltransferase (adenine-specific)
MDYGEWDKKESNQLDLRKVTEELYRVLRQGGTLIAFYDIWKMSELKRWSEDAGFRMLRLIEWLKTNPTPLNQYATYLTNAREQAIVGVKGSNPTFNGKYDKGVYTLPIPRASGGLDRHPTQKPLALFKALIEKHSNLGDLVLDCFLGSGTTAVAAVETGRRITGCEIDRRYYQTVLRRLSRI